MINPFFKNKGPIKIDDILISANISNKYEYVETNQSTTGGARVQGSDM